MGASHTHSWSPRLTDAAPPLYRAIADAIETDVAEGRLAPGTRLPTHRALAASLGVDLTTVTRAFSEAARRGLILSEGRRGSFVRRSAPVGRGEEAAEELASGMNMPPEPSGGSIRRALAEGIGALLKEPFAPIHYQPSGGGERDRAAAALFLAESIEPTSPAQVLITAGGQNALDAVLVHILGAGDRVAAPDHTYPGFLEVARRLGAEVVPLPGDEAGILPDALERAAARGTLRALYVVPTNDNPTTATLPTARRKEIARIAERHGLAIVEDDPYGRLPARPPAPIARFAPDRTWYVSSVSKIISPALRVGFVRAPSSADAEALKPLIHESAVMAPPLNVALVSGWIESGLLPRLIADVRSEATARMAEAKVLLGPWQPSHHPEGYHLWLPVPPEVATQATAAGLAAIPSNVFAVVPGGAAPALRISLGGSASRSRVFAELRRLARLLAQDKGVHRRVV